MRMITVLKTGWLCFLSSDETDSDYDGTPVKRECSSLQPSSLSARAQLSHLPIKNSGAVGRLKVKTAAKAGPNSKNQVKKKKDAASTSSRVTFSESCQEKIVKFQTSETHEKGKQALFGSDVDDVISSQDSSFRYVVVLKDLLFCPVMMIPKVDDKSEEDCDT